MLEKARHHALRLCIVGVFLTGAFANALPPQGNSPTFLIEIPDSQVAPTSQAVLNLPSASVQLILIHILRPEADNVDYGQIYPQLNGAAAARISELRPSERGKVDRLNLKSRPGFQLLPGNNTLEILAVNRSGRELRARFLLHIPKGVCSGGGSAKVLSFQRLIDTLRSGVSNERLIQYVLDCGVDFELGAETVEKLQGAGAANKLIEAIRSPTAPEFAEYQSRGLRTQELMTMLQVGMSQEQVIQEVENRGVSFEFTAENDQKLRAAGAGDKLIDAIHYMAGDESALTRPRGLRVSEIVELLEGGVDTNRIFELVRQRGVSFRLDSETEVRFRGAGANEKLMRAIRTAAENYAAPH